MLPGFMRGWNPVLEPEFGPVAPLRSFWTREKSCRFPMVRFPAGDDIGGWRCLLRNFFGLLIFPFRLINSRLFPFPFYLQQSQCRTSIIISSMASVNGCSEFPCRSADLPINQWFSVLTSMVHHHLAVGIFSFLETGKFEKTVATKMTILRFASPESSFESKFHVSASLLLSLKTKVQFNYIGTIIFF